MRLFCLSLVVLSLCTGCRGAEGHYTIDRDLTAPGLDRFVDQHLEQVFSQGNGEKAQISEDLRKQVKEEMEKEFEQVEINLELESSGKASGSSTIEESTNTMEGTWTLRGDVLEITETHGNGKPLAKPKTSTFHYEDGRLSFNDPESPFPYLILSRQ